MGQYNRIAKDLFSIENIKYSLIFLFLLIVFGYLVRGFLVRHLTDHLEKIEMLPLSAFWKSILYFLFLTCFTPFIILILKRKYEVLFLGYFVPALIVSLYGWHETIGWYAYTSLWNDKIGVYSGYLPWWSLCEIIPVFILIYLLRRSVSLQDDIIGIISFCLIYSVLTLPIPFQLMGACCLLSSLFISSIFFGIFGAVYLILLSFVVEKIAKIKIFRRATQTTPK